jgi:hypothetical protein
LSTLHKKIIVQCISVIYLSPGNLPLITEKAGSSMGSLDSGFDSQSMEVDEDGRIEDGMIGDKCGKRLSPNAPTSSPELLQAVKKCRENTEISEKVIQIQFIKKYINLHYAR